MSRFVLVMIIGGGLVGSVAGCANAPGVVGDACADADECESGLSCFNRPGATVTPVCMADCDLATTPICADGSVCLARVGGGAGVCYLGGTGAPGTACDGALDCQQGSICVNSGGMTQCATACVVGDDSRCGTGETCSALMSGGGFCAAP
ncbi:MAG: hypothetical protein H6719_15650 [Sandaracinaceae bacterium]|nr:hypothetical protein [Sandaracinaceae bacterium]